jgi:4-alpha-glucanotransferase
MEDWFMFARGSGILLHISSLPSKHGIGDLGPEAYRLADILQRGSQSYWQVLPLNPIHPHSYHSPYFSSSANAGNPLLISLEKLVAQDILKAHDIPEGHFQDCEVDYHNVTDYKYPILEKASTNHMDNKRGDAFKNFCREQKFWLDDYAFFRAVNNKFNEQVWSNWPEEIKFRKPEVLEKIRHQCEIEIEREKWYQFIFFSQWKELKDYCNERGIRIIGDIPIYVSFESVDLWTHPDLFKLDNDFNPVAVSGVPPDYFSETGQLWNNPVYNWDTMKSEGFKWWVDRMRVMFDRFDIIRIDHFRGLVQYWEVPAGETTAVNGSWQPVPTYDLFDTLTEQIPGFPVIAEDLGIITDDVRDVMNHYHFPGMKVLLFAFGEDNPVHPYLPHMYMNNSFVYTGTHDNNTIRGWLEHEASEEDIRRVCAYIGVEKKTELIITAMIRLAQASVAKCAIIPLQDLLMLGADCRMNQPAVVEGNWKWRMTSSQMEQVPVQWLSEMAFCYGRIPG